MDSKNILINGSDKDKLAAIKGDIIEAVAKSTVSTKIKNKYGVGDPAAGSVTYDRFKNAESKDYGTARGAGKGAAIVNSGKVTNLINDSKEIVEEFENSDVKRYGVSDLLNRRKANSASSMARYLDTAFSAKAVAEGQAIVGLAKADPIQDTIEKAIQTVETVVNDWVDGVDRSEIVVVVKPAIYGRLANYLNEVKNEITGSVDVMFNGQVRVFSNHRQTKDIIVMHEGAIAQDVNVYDYDPQRVPFSNAVESSLFYDQGTKAVEPDLVFHGDLA